MFGVYMPIETAMRVDEEAENDDRSRSYVINRILVNHYRRKKNHDSKTNP